MMTQTRRPTCSLAVAQCGSVNFIYLKGDPLVKALKLCDGRNTNYFCTRICQHIPAVIWGLSPLCLSAGLGVMSGRGPGGGRLDRGQQRKRGWYRTCSGLGYIGQFPWRRKKTCSSSFSAKEYTSFIEMLCKKQSITRRLGLANNRWQGGILWPQNKEFLIVLCFTNIMQVSV